MATTDERDVVANARDDQPGLAPDGDDIVVVPGSPGEPRRPRRWIWPVVTLLVIVLLVAGGFAVSRGDPGARPTVVVDGSAAATPSVPSAVKPVANAKTKKPVSAPAVTPTTVAAPVAPATPIAPVAPVAPAAPSNVARKAVRPPAVPALPKPPSVQPVSVLQWTVPSVLTVKRGVPVSFDVSAHNPTAGVVSLPHPLSCAPQLDNGEFCTEVTEPIGPNGTAHAHYVINTGAVAPGTYTLNIEGLRTVTLHVTA